MKKILFVLALPLFLLTPSFALASTLLFDHTINTKLRSDENLYVLGKKVGIGAPVLGDVIAAAGLVTVSENVSGDTLLAGETVNIGAPVEGDARFLGRSILLSRPVGGDVVGVGSNIQISSGTTIGKGIFLVGDSISFAGTADGNVFLRGRDITIDGSIGGNADIKTNGDISFGPNAKIHGDLSYAAVNQREIPPGIVLGKVIKKESPVLSSLSRENLRSYLGVLAGTFFIIKMLALIVAALLLVVLARKFSTDVSLRARKVALRSALIGFVVLVALPAAGILALITIVGFFVGLFFFSLYITLLLLAGAYSGVIFGDALYEKWRKMEPKSPWLTALFGVIVLALLSLIPYAGQVLAFVVFIISLGAISTVSFRKIFPRAE